MRLTLVRQPKELCECSVIWVCHLSLPIEFLSRWRPLSHYARRCARGISMYLIRYLRSSHLPAQRSLCFTCSKILSTNCPPECAELPHTAVCSQSISWLSSAFAITIVSFGFCKYLSLLLEILPFSSKTIWKSSAILNYIFHWFLLILGASWQPRSTKHERKRV